MSNSLLDNYQKTVFAFVVVAVVVVAVVVEETRGLYIPLISQVEVRMERFGPSFFPSIYASSTKIAGHENQERRKKRGSILCRTDLANEANKMFIIWLCGLP